MRKLSPLVGVVLLGTISGCGAENVKRGFYEGLTLAPIQSSPHDRVIQSDRPSYSEYERLRKERDQQR